VSSWCSSLDFLRTPGAKQHNGLIARNDHFSGHRLSVTVMTSSWSDGRRGPLGICFPKGMLKATKVEEWNEKHRGRAYLFSSEKRTHFMSGETWVLLQQKLFGDAFAMQRKVHKLSQSVEGLILADAWTGYHSFSTGLNEARDLWSKTNRVRQPSEQPGGWSSNCQPVDQLHHIFRAKMDQLDCSDVACVPDLLGRKRYHEMSIRPSGQVAHPALQTATLADRTLEAWESMRLVQPW